MFRAPLCPSSGAREYYTNGCCLSYLVLGFQVVGTVWSWGLCVRFAGCCFSSSPLMGIIVPETCCASNKICNKKHLLHLFGILFPHINEDARSKSHQTFTMFTPVHSEHKFMRYERNFRQGIYTPEELRGKKKPMPYGEREFKYSFLKHIFQKFHNMISKLTHTHTHHSHIHTKTHTKSIENNWHY
jgi:hypothetical protein